MLNKLPIIMVAVIACIVASALLSAGHYKKLYDKTAESLEFAQQRIVLLKILVESNAKTIEHQNSEIERLRVDTAQKQVEYEKNIIDIEHKYDQLKANPQIKTRTVIKYLEKEECNQQIHQINSLVEGFYESTIR